MKLGPIHSHDCDGDCIYIGSFNVVSESNQILDAYVHEHPNGLSEGVLRYGNDGPEYYCFPLRYISMTDSAARWRIFMLLLKLSGVFVDDGKGGGFGNCG